MMDFLIHNLEDKGIKLPNSAPYANTKNDSFGCRWSIETSSRFEGDMGIYPSWTWTPDQEEKNRFFLSAKEALMDVGTERKNSPTYTFMKCCISG